MNVALIGSGKMGRMIRGMAADYDMTVTAVFDIDDPLRDDDETKRRLDAVPVLIDFTVPDAALPNVRTAALLGKNLVVGTTGWHDSLPAVGEIVRSAGIGVVYAANFSLGVNLFYKIADYAGALFAACSRYEPYLLESHHKAKKDAPSGTALALASILGSAMNRSDIPVTSLRAGYIPGMHEIGFDSRSDTVRLVHSARSREGFADGSLLAARWINGRTGLYRFADVLDDVLSGT
ncbi:4-hydroxy-tetrahydrodipicolinate reductase [bacterium]|nr:4-hydroxy-tetrahydrodipicolinate reductase [bacterium]